MDFSIIIPAKNETANIGRCLASIRTQSYPADRFEVLLIDNGSADRTADLARDLGVRVFVRPGVTISALRNFGAARSRGAILAFLDADCTVAHDWLSRAAAYLQRQDIPCFGAPPEPPSEATWVQRAWFLVRGKRGPVEPVSWLESMNMFVRREAFAAVGGFNETLITCEDYDLSLRLGKRGPILADSSIRAVHHGEAATLRQFVRKEYWRGSSNLKGVASHGLDWRELPSLLIPLVYCLLLALVLIGLLWQGLAARSASQVTTLLLACWLGAPLLPAGWKGRHAGSLLQTGQLALLLHLYFLARGGAMFRAPRVPRGS